jgi:M6 family metalloprotease-like protein
MQDTLHVLAIRVEFLPDTLSTTTGDGTFESAVPEDVVIDPLPHNRDYFEDHVMFLKNYFSEISKGNIVIADDFQVFPQGQNEAYTLPNQMWHYNYNTGNSEDLDRSLAELFVDAWTEAWKIDSLQLNPILSGYDLFIIFHAGVGQDFDVGFDETPHDIPSAYFRLADLRDALADPDYLGVPVGSDYITDGILLPETERQQEADVEIAMNGTAALLMGHWLGLPALYNTETGASGVGRFDFMDQGSGNFAGMVPARPCAWTREFMGWEEPVLITPDSQLDTFWIKQVTAEDTLHEIYRINLNESEHYLIENRSGDPEELQYTIARDRQGRRLKIRDNYDLEILDGDFGVIVEVDNYDFGLVALQDGLGEGILIWHIDETVINEKYASNTINNERSRRGVHLVEGDGADDIGREYGILAIQDLGWWGDFWFAGNEPFLNANTHLNTIRLFDGSYPNTRTHDGSSTGLNITGFSARDSIMSFMVSNSWTRPGFPKRLAESPGDFSPSAIDSDGDGDTDWILTVTPAGAVQIFDSVGAAQGTVIEIREDTNLLGDPISVTDTLYLRVGEITATPAICPYGDGFMAFFPGDTLGTFYKVTFFPLTEGFPPDVTSVDLDGQFSGTPLLMGEGLDCLIYAGYEEAVVLFDEDLQLMAEIDLFDSGKIVGLCLDDTTDTANVFALSTSGQAALVNYLINTVLWTIDLPSVPDYEPLCLLHSPDQRDLVVISSNGDVVFIDPETGDFRPGFPFHAGMTVTASPAAGDFNADGYLDMVLVGDHRLTAVQPTGALAANWPISIDNGRPFEPILSPPTVAELQDELRVMFGWPGGSVDARDNGGQAPNGFALSTGSTITSAPMVVQLDTSVTGEAELIALDEAGYLYAWNLEQMGSFTQMRLPWNGYQGGITRQGVAYDEPQIQPIDPRLLNVAKVYPWPNPAKEVVHIRYKMGQNGRITARIFDGTGDLVKELSATAQAGFEADLVWNLDDVTSGIYIGRIEAEAGNKKEKAFIKIAVVK